MNPLLLTDGYKTSHHKMYPEGTTYVYANFTPRSTKRMPEGAKDIVVAGIIHAVIYIDAIFRDNFFLRNKSSVIAEAKEYFDAYLGTDYDMSHFEALHDLGYLPIKIKALEEGTVVSEKIPVLTIVNTDPRFYWLPNFLETLLSSLIWKPMHSASVAYAYKKILLKYARETDKDNVGFVNFQGHDFSFRGMQSPEAATYSGLGFAFCFKGGDTLPVLQIIDMIYGKDSMVHSVPASEHSVMTAYGKEDEIEAFRRLMKVYPTGILSVVSDSFDLWQVCTKFLPILKDEILARDGKLVIRPDSGDPVDIICGTSVGLKGNPEEKGVVELLWDVFGGTINDQGYKVLDPHIGCIYGDSITLERAEQICSRLKAKGFASTNVVLGVGSYSLGYATRDNQGGAMKATYCEVYGQGREIFKDPITDDGTKKSAKGLLRVIEKDGKLVLEDQVSHEDESTGLLNIVYRDGEIPNYISLAEIREKIDKSI